MSTGELSSTAGMKVAMDRLDDIMRERGVSAETRRQVIELAQMMYEYIPYAYKQKKDPTDPKVLAAFLGTKGKHMAKLLGNDSLNCGLAMVDFVLSANRAAVVTSTGFPPAITLAYGLAMINLIEVGNACSFAQQAYYEAFLRESDVKLQPVRARVRQSYPKETELRRLP